AAAAGAGLVPRARGAGVDLELGGVVPGGVRGLRAAVAAADPDPERRPVHVGADADGDHRAERGREPRTRLKRFASFPAGVHSEREAQSTKRQRVIEYLWTHSLAD